MAIYTIPYACGHGTFDVELLGDMRLREKRLAKLGEKRCPNCVKKRIHVPKSMRETAPFRMIVTIPRIPVGSEPYMMISFGNSFDYKKFLKERGYRYGLPETVRTHYNENPCWNKRFSEHDVKKEIRELTELKIVVLKDYTDEEKTHSKTMCKKYEDAENRKPIWIRNHAWNQVIYGYKTKFIYLDGKKTTITREQENSLKNYVDQLKNASWKGE